MDMGSSTTMSMSMSMTPTQTSVMSTSTDMSSMSMGGSCKISMLWNWYTIDACFLSSTWRVTSSGMFAGSCFGVICLVIALEFLRRLGREYDKHLKRRFTYGRLPGQANQDDSSSETQPSASGKTGVKNVDRERFNTGTRERRRAFSPSILQQAARAAIQMVQFGVAYFVMLLAMYYNGYFIICIIIGAFIGSFIFSWDQATFSESQDAVEVTGCCG